MEGKARVFSATGLGSGVTVDGLVSGNLTLNATVEVDAPVAAAAAADEGAGADEFFLGVACFLGEAAFFVDFGAPGCLL